MLRVFFVLCVGLAVGSPAHSASQDALHPPAIATFDVDGTTRWLGKELALTSTQVVRVRAILELERCTQASARAKGLVIQNAPPLADIRYVDADSLAPVRNRRSSSATMVLRAAQRRAAAKEWLERESERTELHPKLVGLRVTALDDLLHVLSADQAKRFRELLGGQGVEWIRELAAQRLRPDRSSKSAGGNAARSRDFERAAQLKAQAHARAEARRKALIAAQKKRASRARGSGRGRGQSRGRGRGRGL